jgi:hypothetical protein
MAPDHALEVQGRVVLSLFEVVDKGGEAGDVWVIQRESKAPFLTVLVCLIAGELS